MLANPVLMLSKNQSSIDVIQQLFVNYRQSASQQPMKGTTSPRVKKISAKKMTSPQRMVITGMTEQQIKHTSSKTLNNPTTSIKTVHSTTAVKSPPKPPIQTLAANSPTNTHTVGTTQTTTKTTLSSKGKNTGPAVSHIPATSSTHVHSSNSHKNNVLPSSPRNNGALNNINNNVSYTNNSVSNSNSNMHISNSNPNILTKIQNKLHLKQHNLFYDGNLIDGKFEGQGILYVSHPQQYIYNGDWHQGARHGYGHYIYPDSSHYEGQWVTNTKSGQGTYTNQHGQKYEGDWLDNMRHGSGKIKYKNGTVMDGQWVSDVFVSGRVLYVNGDSYEGTMQDYQLSGLGQYKYSDGKQRYHGNYSHNQKQHNGTYYFGNGDIFEGSFHNNNKQGNNCRYIWNNGKYQLINGQFINDRAVHGTIYDRKQRKNVKNF